MHTKGLEEVFENKIVPELGRVQKKEKYLGILSQLVANSAANSGRGIREAQLTDEVKPATHVLNRLAKNGFVEITLPIGDGTLIVDSINNIRALFNKRQFISDYLAKFRSHMGSDKQARQIAMETRQMTSKAEFDAWLNLLEDQDGFAEYNEVVFALVNQGVNLVSQKYGLLQWRKMAKYYNISDKMKDLLEDD